MGQADVRFEVTKAKVSWSGIVLGILSGPGAGDPADTIGKYPEIAVYNSHGVRRLLETTDTNGEAMDRAAIIEDDFNTLGAAEWCERYDVPLSFVSD
jgi:hypothetical protein